eukprot:CAMPEP_0197824888 /NCGR_PEP_ID=MMETSP1437-20131217/2088_1 /TAXON_ID=49252 ORGANISM="Eucampia antarctica, Strain CCMP1452" /NCGR_SAMPLE_ID=MMETSP1437 /ASSEMBLY_ACC=CAM_ASM_001096 /LENGTH=425 /DNA_ID=CAMNT_0043424693 /DNA_START=85 /DNA_END=1362 /DNA_ORIENTATION=-
MSPGSVSTTTSTTGGSYLSDVPLGLPDAILGIAEAFGKCEDPNKVNVCVGAYRDENGKPWILPSVREAEREMLKSDSGVNKEYAPIVGNPSFVRKALEFAYGEEIVEERSIAGAATLSGTGACRIGGAFLSKFLAPGTKIYLPNPTWGNHVAIFKEAGLEVERYRYYSLETNGLDFDHMKLDLLAAPTGSVVLLHACAHNPTGCDPTHEQWAEISTLCQERQLHVFFDCAYQGFASGNSEQDAWAIRKFVQDGGHASLMLAQSFAKNFGLYGERCGTLSILTDSDEEKERVMSQLKLIIRPMYSSPPIHGAHIVNTVLSSPLLSKQYQQECAHMANRIDTMRTKLVQSLKEANSTHDWSHITNQIGMFAYTGMNSDMCQTLTDQYHIFLTKDGRVSLAGLNENNIQYVANAIHKVTDGKPITTIV